MVLLRYPLTTPAFGWGSAIIGPGLRGSQCVVHVRQLVVGFQIRFRAGFMHRQKANQVLNGTLHPMAFNTHALPTTLTKVPRTVQRSTNSQSNLVLYAHIYYHYIYQPTLHALCEVCEA